MARATHPLSSTVARAYRRLPEGRGLRPLEDALLERLCPDERPPAAFVWDWLARTVDRSPSDALYLYQLLGLAEGDHPAPQAALARDHLQHRQVICRLVARLRADCLAVLPAHHPLHRRLKGEPHPHVPPDR